MYSQQQQPGAQYPGQGYPQQQYPQQQYQPAPQQYQQPPQQLPQQPIQPQAPPVPQGPQKDTVVAEEFKKFVQSQTWQVLDHAQGPGQHILKLAPPAGRKLVKGDVKKAQITVRSMGQTPAAPGAPPSGANSIQVSLDTEEKAGFFGADKKSYPLWLNADEEVDAAMQPTTGLKDKVRNICTQAKITLPPPPPAPPLQPQFAPAPAPGYLQQQPAAQMAAPPQVPAASPPQSQAAPAPMQPTYQPPAFQQQPPAQQQWVAQPQTPQFGGQTASQPQAPQYGAQPAPQPQAPQYGAQPTPQSQQWQQRICTNPNCQAPNSPNAATCYRCGYRLQ